MNTYDILKAGYIARGAGHSEEEKQKLGTYRGGSTGVVLTSDGDMESGFDVAGNCHRQALARSLGSPHLDTDPLDPVQIMFEAGKFNEDAWCEVLEAGLPEGYRLLREEEIPVKWETDMGTPVTGRPDIVIADAQGNWIKGLELKLSSAVWSARDAVLEGKPKFIHLAQAAHYSMELGVPYELWYTSRTNFTAEEWAISGVMPQWGEPRSEHIEYTYGVQISDGFYKSGKRKGQPKMKFRKVEVLAADRGLSAAELKDKYGVTHGRFRYIKPYHMGYSLDWKGDVLTYTPLDGSGPTVHTPITKSGIRQFYNLLDEMGETGDLGPRPLVLTGDGEVVTKYSACQYCPLQAQCDKYDEVKDFELWKEEISGDN